MAYRELLILLPCHSLEDFPTHHEGDDAANLLALWTALWHPQLIAAAGAMPQWARVDDAPHDVQNKLIAIPNIAKERLPTGFTQRARDAGAVLLRNQLTRAPLVVAALEPLGGSCVSDDIAHDFHALGYAYLQIQLLTRQMRYASNLDEAWFGQQLVAAAQGLLSGDEATFRDRLAACFNLLGEERDRYYPVDAHVIDLALVAETTLGDSLRQELASPAPLNLLMNAQLLERLAAQAPSTLEQLRGAVQAGTISVLGGDWGEPRLRLLALDDLLSTLQQGLRVYDEHLGKGPAAYARRRCGLSAMLPSILHRLGMAGALHATFDEGRFPHGSQLKVSWEGRDGTAIDAIARLPLEASQPKTFLQYSNKLGESMDHDHVATLLLAHWPGTATESLHDLRRVAKYTACLGKLVTFETWLAETTGGQLERFEADKYKSPWLKQAVIRKQPDPLSSVQRYWQRRTLWEAAEACHSLTEWIRAERLPPLPPLDREILAAAEEGLAGDLDERLSALRQAAAEQLALQVCSPQSGSRGLLLLNPWACVRRLVVDRAPLPHAPAVAKPVYAAAQASARTQLVVDVPGQGFAFISGSSAEPAPSRTTQRLVEGTNILRNEFFEAVVHPVTGILQSVHTYQSRRNRLSQQLALRTPGPPGKTGETYRDPDETAIYSVMAADSVEVTCDTPACGELTVRGRLLDRQGTSVANYVQQFQVWRGSRVLRLAIELEPLVELGSDPWNSYFASRFAWGEEAVDITRSVHAQACVSTSQQMEAPHYIEVSHAQDRTTLLTGGLPFHRRVGPALIDTLLVTRGETARRFQLGFGIDLPYPLHEALALLAAPVSIPLVDRAPSQDATGWLLHVGARNVVTTHLSSLYDGNRVVGCRVRLLETVGRGVETTLATLRPFRSAQVVDFRGRTLHECELRDGQALVRCAPFDWLEVVATW